MKKLYMFDCFGVIIRDVGNVWVNRHGIIAAGNYNKWRETADKNDLGKISSNELFQRISKLSGQSHEGIKSEWKKNATVNMDVIETIMKLRENGVKLAMLSNAGDYVREYLEKYNIEELFDEVFLSYEIGLHKPDEKYYQYALGKMNTKPEDACFIDDRIENLEPAERLGIQGILYPSEDFSKII